MLIVPIGHDETAIERVPWVTLWVFALCVSLYLVSWPREFESARDAERSWLAVESYWSEHPYLGLAPEIRGPLLRANGLDEDAGALAQLASYRVPPADAAELAREQAEFDRLQGEVSAARASHPARALGLTPARPKSYQWVTHMFMHGSWGHLAGNMLLLLLVGYCLEDRWGRPVFGAVYGIGGLAACALFAFRYPDLQGPLVGASGAIAALMGAFLVRFATRKIQFFYWVALVFRGTFRLPAWFVMLFWIGNEFLSAWAVDQSSPSSGGGVAHWAHIGGFAFGAVVALGIRASGAEERWLAPAIHAKVSQYRNALLERTLEQLRAGRKQEVFEFLQRELPKDPENRDAAQAYWDLALDLGRASQAAPLFYGFVRRDVRLGAYAQAVDVLHELHSRAPEQRFDAATLVRLALGLREQGAPDEDARFAAQLALQAQPPGAALPSALRLASAFESADPALAAQIAQSGLLAQQLTAESRAQLERIAAHGAGKRSAALPLRRDVPLTLSDDADGDEDWLEIGSGVRKPDPPRRG